LFKPAHEKPAIAEKLRQIVEGYSGWHFVNRNPEMGRQPPAIAQLESIRAPVLVMVGEREGSPPQSGAKRGQVGMLRRVSAST
jgi:hypothetical protein